MFRLFELIEFQINEFSNQDELGAREDESPMTSDDNTMLFGNYIIYQINFLSIISIFLYLDLTIFEKGLDNQSEYRYQFNNTLQKQFRNNVRSDWKLIGIMICF